MSCDDQDVWKRVGEQTRGHLDAFVWDDGWDDFDSLWGFHGDFPNGFQKLKEAGAKYGAAQGVWMSPWGGYGEPEEETPGVRRISRLRNEPEGVSRWPGRNIAKLFVTFACKMMRENGVVFFKFDGMGAGGGAGAPGELADDVDAVLNLTSELRKENPDLFISATVGTWASPFWTLVRRFHLASGRRYRLSWSGQWAPTVDHLPGYVLLPMYCPMGASRIHSTR